jgi:hypothetical protein
MSTINVNDGDKYDIISKVQVGDVIMYKYGDNPITVGEVNRIFLTCKNGIFKVCYTTSNHTSIYESYITEILPRSSAVKL